MLQMVKDFHFPTACCRAGTQATPSLERPVWSCAQRWRRQMVQWPATMSCSANRVITAPELRTGVRKDGQSSRWAPVHVHRSIRNAELPTFPVQPTLVQPSDASFVRSSRISRQLEGDMDHCETTVSVSRGIEDEGRPGDNTKAESANARRFRSTQEGPESQLL